jgi:peptidoglycan/LPS O-acetylase OafA/YrhL
VPEAGTGGRTPRDRIEFLDGLRGIAVLWVVVFHLVYLLERAGLGLLGADAPLTPWLHGLGMTALVVLSGFCLMLPVVRGGPTAMTTPRQILDFLRGRARRILPAYYAALVTSLALVILASHLRLGVSWRAELHSTGNLVAHILLLHNLSDDWAWRINAPLWALATFWQMYVVFPTVLLPIWRRLGNVATVVAGFALGLLPLLLFSHLGDWQWARPWMLGDFALGMAGAAIAHAPARDSRDLIDRMPWMALALVCLAATPASVHFFGEYWWGGDALRGAACTCLILECTRQNLQSPERPSPLLRVLSSRAATRVGAFSYSIFLVHFPIERSFVRFLASSGFEARASFAIALLVVLPCILAAAYAFHLIFEKPAMRRRGTPYGSAATAKGTA